MGFVAPLEKLLLASLLSWLLCTHVLFQRLENNPISLNLSGSLSGRILTGERLDWAIQLTHPVVHQEMYFSKLKKMTLTLDCVMTGLQR